MDVGFKDKVNEIVVQALKLDRSYFRAIEYQLSKHHPVSAELYFKERIFNKITSLKKSPIGSLWIIAGCPNFLLNEEGWRFIQKYLIKSYSDPSIVEMDKIYHTAHVFANTYFEIQELKNLKGSIISNVDPRFIDFWKQFGKVNIKTGDPYMSKADIEIFLHQVFEGTVLKSSDHVSVLNPSIRKVELRHGIWLFYDQFKQYFNKEALVLMMKRCFPELLNGSIETEVSNVRDHLKYSTRVFQRT